MPDHIDKVPRPLWQLLLLTHNQKKPVNLTCEECFALLEYDADLLTCGATLEEIRPSAHYHLSLCPTCWKKFDSWLEKLVVARTEQG